MKNINLITKLWQDIALMDTEIIKANWLNLGNFYGSETILGLSPLPKFLAPDIPDKTILTKKPAFKNLDIRGIQYLRVLVDSNYQTQEVIEWAETIMRFLEINLTVLKVKCKNKFGSIHTGKTFMLELTAFMMDCHYAWNDLRFLNIVLKLMDLHWLYSFDGAVKLKPGQKDTLHTDYLQFRLLIMREAALKKLTNGSINA